MEIKRGELKKDAEIVARHGIDAVRKGAQSGRVYVFDDFGDHHAQSVRNALNADDLVAGRVAVKRIRKYPGYREMVIKN